jgi:leader peptidase (prepilin peptidase)/N-methyltransferase
MNYELYTIIAFSAVFGACVGSFLNVVISRLPQKGAFLSKSRSCCPSCGHTVRWFDLIPVVSWLLLLGRCRDCKARIPPRYLLVEASGALLAVAGFWRFGVSFGTVLAFGVTMILLAVALIDFATSEIPDSLIIALVPFAICAVWVFTDVPILARTIGFFTVSLPMLVLALAIKGAFGGGDIKLMAVCGFLLGWKSTLAAFFIALLLGGSWAIYMMLSGKRKRGEHMVFSPALCTGVAAALFFGEVAVDWYLRVFFIW